MAWRLATMYSSGSGAPDGLQKREDEEIAVYYLTPHGPFEPKKRPRVPVFRENETDEDADRPMRRTETGDYLVDGGMTIKNA